MIGTPLARVVDSSPEYENITLGGSRYPSEGVPSPHVRIKQPIPREQEMID